MLSKKNQFFQKIIVYSSFFVPSTVQKCSKNIPFSLLKTPKYRNDNFQYLKEKKGKAYIADSVNFLPFPEIQTTDENG